MLENNSHFSKKLITWYLQNKRELPWRQTKDPYHIWLSEIILQQTRVAQGLPYYKKFVKTYPKVQLLANASETAILKLWQGLGYYSRARNLHTTAKYVTEELKGVFPNNYQDLKKLKGVGDYTASAIASICYNEAAAVVDGNVYRVLSRVFGINTAINSTAGIKEFKQVAQELIDSSQPGDYNQAIMEFGARYCVPQNPDCTHCIFSSNCEALKSKRVGELPVKLKKAKIRKRYFNYIVLLSSNGATVLKQRTGKGIWQNLYEFPLVETPVEASAEALKANFAAAEILDRALDGSEETNNERLIKYNATPIIHKLSHQHLYTTFWIVELDTLQAKSVPISEVIKYPVPILIGNFISEFSEFQKPLER